MSWPTVPKELALAHLYNLTSCPSTPFLLSSGHSGVFSPFFPWWSLLLFCLSRMFFPCSSQGWLFLTNLVLASFPQRSLRWLLYLTTMQTPLLPPHFSILVFFFKTLTTIFKDLFCQLNVYIFPATLKLKTYLSNKWIRTGAISVLFAMNHKPGLALDLICSRHSSICWKNRWINIYWETSVY